MCECVLWYMSGSKRLCICESYMTAYYLRVLTFSVEVCVCVRTFKSMACMFLYTCNSKSALMESCVCVSVCASVCGVARLEFFIRTRKMCVCVCVCVFGGMCVCVSLSERECVCVSV